MKSPFIQVCSIEFCISNHETDWYKGASYIPKIRNYHPIHD